MRRYSIYIFTFLLGFTAALVVAQAAGLDIPGENIVKDPSMQVDIGAGGGEAAALAVGLRILWLLKIVVSGFALIYMVMIGVYLIIGNDSEEVVKKQKKQIFYAFIAFLFLNIPSLVYQIFVPDQASQWSVTGVNDWKDHRSSIFWNTSGFDGIIGGIIGFLRVFVYGAAILMFTWWIFQLLVSGWDDEKRKLAKNRIVYGSIALIFMAFVDLWGSLIAMGDFAKYIPSVWRQVFNLALYFAGPFVIFMLMYGAYFYITSAGDEERAKKGKSIVINTLIATLILIAALSFLTELVKFQL